MMGSPEDLGPNQPGDVGSDPGAATSDWAEVLSTSSCQTRLSPGNSATITVGPGPVLTDLPGFHSNMVCNEDYAMNMDYDSKFSSLMFVFFLKKGDFKKVN